jgi:hypothetical protein
MPTNFEGEFLKTPIRSTILYGTECWTVKKKYIHTIKEKDVK